VRSLANGADGSEYQVVRGGEVKFDIPHRFFKVYCRQLSVLGADGSQKTYQVTLSSIVSSA
jgi:hypothetical protein